MSNNQTVSLNIRLTGNAGRELQQLTQQQQRGVQQINQGWQRVSTTQAQYTRGLNTARMTQEQINRITQQNVQYARNLNDMNRLGLRTQQQITNEIRNSENAYRRLSQASNVSSQDLRRAYQSMRQQVRQLNDELRTTPKLTQRIGSAINTGTAIAGGVVAGASVINSQIQPARSYDEQVARMTVNASQVGMSETQRNQLKTQISQTVENAVRNGGSREDVANAGAFMLDSGKFTASELPTALNATAKTAFASGANATEMANVAVALKTFGISTDKLATAQEAIYVGGKAGAFGLKAQAKFLPSQLAQASVAGYTGLEGVKHLTALNQTAMLVAGSQDEAGNYVNNLLGKLTAPDLASAVAKNITLQKGDYTKKDGKKTVFDLDAYFQKQREQGVMPVQALAKLVDREMANDKKYQQLKTEASNAKTTDERRQTLEAMQKMLTGSFIGSILTDKESRMAFLAASQNSQQYNDVYNRMSSGAGEIQADSQWLGTQEFATNQQNVNEQLNINYQAYLNVNGALKTYNTEMAGFMEKHSGLATGAYTAGVALATLGATATVGTLITKFGSLGGVMTSATAGVNALGASSIAAKAGLLGLAGMVGWEIGSAINKYVIDGTETGRKFGDATGEYIAKGLAFLGDETAKQAVADQEKYDKMIAEQQQTRMAIQQTTNAIKSIDFSQNIIQNITNPQPSMPFYKYPTPASPITDLKRGAVVPMWLK
ncbi:MULTISPECIES: phage tail tape measure protein [unclassified Moraxella]|uniref:phage tail tape measure protein n=1 Tax=unclassified Moraxella TaxID=2685852 RepID=UPI003AF4BD00